MIELLHYLNDPRLWELWYVIMGNAGFISSTVVGFGDMSSKEVFGDFGYRSWTWGEGGFLNIAFLRGASVNATDPAPYSLRL